MESNADNIIITAVKQAEDSKDTIVRFYETNGKPGKISFNVFDKKIESTVSPFEIKTFNTNGKELNLIEW